MEIYDFNKCKENGLRYGGHAGNKLGIIIDNENWFLKFPKSTKDLTAHHNERQDALHGDV